VVSNSAVINIEPTSNILNNAKPFDSSSYKSPSKFKWMKLSGILGIVYLLSAFLSLAIFYFLKDSLATNITYSYFFLGISVFFYISLFFFFYGFVKMGKYGDSGVLKFAAKSNMVLLVLIVLLFIAGIVFSMVLLGDFAAQLMNLNQNTINNSLKDYLIVSIAFAMGCILLILFLIVNAFCFAIGLIQVGKEVKFAKISGNLMFIDLIGLIVPIALIGAISFVPSLSSNIISLGIILSIVMVILGIIGLASCIFMILALFFGSRKFE
jgi:hypothetical protein